jgi:multidrug efflux pump subunit AcrB
MTLGGLALAVGILVDVSTVEVENIHSHIPHSPSVARAVRRSNRETAVPRLLAMLCVLAVFLPSFLMQGAAREMFVPLSLAVGFAMIAAYFLSSTFVPALAIWLLKPQHAPQEGEGRFSFDRVRRVYAALLRKTMRRRSILIVGYLTASALAIGLLGPRLGREIFPKVNADEFQLRLRAPDGTRIEVTAALVTEALRLIQVKSENRSSDTGGGKIAVSIAYCGLHPTSYTINNMYLWMRGPEEAVLRVAFAKGSKIDLGKFQEELRDELPSRLKKWLAGRLRREGLTDDTIARRLLGLRLSFEPADIVNQVMSFGSTTPVEISVSGPDFADNRAYADRLFAELAKVPSLRDLQYGQSLDYPAVAVQIDREKAGLSGVTAADIARSLVSATSSSRFVEPIFWADPKTGIGYYTQVEIPPYRMNSAEQIGMTPLELPSGNQLLVRDVAVIREGTVPGEYDRYNMRRLVSINANIEGEDLGHVLSRLEEARKGAGEPPRGVKVDIRGQAVPMQQMFQGLAVGLALSVVVILLLLTAYFQSFRLAVISSSTLPAVLAGVVSALTFTGATLNIQSFMGAIMAVGVATANAILLLTFAEEKRKSGMPAAEAAVEGAQSRLRPVLMTSFAMLAGMIPMALALAEGEEQSAPLGQAVIGGVIAATLATLFVLPSVFAVLQRRAATASPSLDPDDEASRYFDTDQSDVAPSPEREK